MGFVASKIVAWLFSVVVLVVTVRLSRRQVVPGGQPIVWLTLLILATMRSPFLPAYAPFPSLWLATLLAALTWGRGRIFTAIVACWAVLAFAFGVGGIAPPINAAWTFVHTIAAFVLVGIACRALSAPGTSEAPTSLRQPVPA